MAVATVPKPAPLLVLENGDILPNIIQHLPPAFVASILQQITTTIASNLRRCIRAFSFPFLLHRDLQQFLTAFSRIQYLDLTGSGIGCCALFPTLHKNQDHLKELILDSQQRPNPAFLPNISFPKLEKLTINMDMLGSCFGSFFFHSSFFLLCL